MILIIDTTQFKKIKLGICEDMECLYFEKEDAGIIEELLPFVESILKEKNKKLADLKAIAVHEGPGSFTGLRVGITTANILAWSLHIPVFAFNDKILPDILEKINELPKKTGYTKPVIPQYPPLK
jgi:tRNA threonylcarbamoyladenosine biosynthesis protein TsaB